MTTPVEPYKRMNMKNNNEMDREIIFSKSIKAGKRIYYVDVKRNRRDELFLAITESKKVMTDNPEQPQFNFEKHKIFLYREDFEKFQQGLAEAIDFIKEAQGPAAPRPEAPTGEIKLDMSFD